MTHSYNPERRRALSLAFSSLAAYCAAAPLQLIAAPSPTRRAEESPNTSPSLTRAAVIHDALALLASDRDVEGEWQSAFMPLPKGKPYHHSYAYGAASLGRSAPLLIDVVKEVRAGWQNRDARYQDIQRHRGDMLELRFSIALGVAANYGAVKILYAEREDNPRNALAYDAELVRALAGKRRFKTREAKRLFRLLYERTFVGMHTLEPDLDEIDAYLDRYIHWVEQMPREVEKLAEAVVSPPPRGMPSREAFYNPQDPVIAAAEGLRRGLGIPRAANSWDRRSGNSLYASALVSAYANARWVMDAARGRATTKAMMDAIIN